MCSVSAGVAVISEIGNRRRNNRKDIDKVGFMPWSFVTAMALLVFGISVALGTGLISTE
ncbi:hypothetical protein HF685_06620 [Parasphingorhabdus halotolerans]|uniref:Uncharacterized protein n=1 Tax=Parasphingorhabdus halotolerans TaxID=2725558 RepID=A0A6H2DKW8_9SPHN|nr:hypothetical protein HF685_06620 [Parasphingorhabdus halotolerans]